MYCPTLPGASSYLQLHQYLQKIKNNVNETKYSIYKFIRKTKRKKKTQLHKKTNIL